MNSAFKRGAESKIVASVIFLGTIQSMMHSRGVPVLVRQSRGTLFLYEHGNLIHHRVGPWTAEMHRLGYRISGYCCHHKSKLVWLTSKKWRLQRFRMQSTRIRIDTIAD